MNPTLKKRSFRSGWRALACAMMKLSYSRAILPRYSVSSPGNVDRALARELHVVQVQHLVVEALQRAFGERDQPHRQIQAGQPGRGLDQVRQVLEVDHDVLALADAAHGGNQADGGVGFDHASAPPRMGLAIVEWSQEYMNGADEE